MKCVIKSSLCFFFMMVFIVNKGLTETKDVSFRIELEIPKIKTSEYFRPYVAVWIETTQREPIKTLALWYQIDSATNQEDGGKWLKDLRQWWRKIGRNHQANYDSVTGATRRPGNYKIVWQTEHTSELPAGNYFINFEAAREEGGRTFHRVPFTLKTAPNKQTLLKSALNHQTITVPADYELGKITIYLEYK